LIDGEAGSDRDSPRTSAPGRRTPAQGRSAEQIASGSEQILHRVARRPPRATLSTASPSERSTAAGGAPTRAGAVDHREMPQARAYVVAIGEPALEAPPLSGRRGLPAPRVCDRAPSSRHRGGDRPPLLVHPLQLEGLRIDAVDPDSGCWRMAASISASDSFGRLPQLLALVDAPLDEGTVSTAAPATQWSTALTSSRKSDTQPRQEAAGPRRKSERWKPQPSIIRRTARGASASRSGRRSAPRRCWRPASRAHLRRIRMTITRASSCGSRARRRPTPAGNAGAGGERHAPSANQGQAQWSLRSRMRRRRSCSTHSL